MSPPCGHPFAGPPAAGCVPCMNRDVPWWRARWAGGPDDPAGGPGTELRLLLAEAGFAAAGCSCNKRAAEMDLWGAAGCRARREEIVGWLREEYRKLGWLARLGAGLRAARGGLVFDLRDPVGGLVDEAVRRAEKSPAAGGE